MKKFELALEKNKMALELEPDNHEYLNDYGYALYEAGYNEEAIKWLKKAADESGEMIEASLEGF